VGNGDLSEQLRALNDGFLSGVTEGRIDA